MFDLQEGAQLLPEAVRLDLIRAAAIKEPMARKIAIERVVCVARARYPDRFVDDHDIQAKPARCESGK